MRELVIAPDIVSDFTNMKFADNSFKLVIFDPPHMNKLGKSSWLARKYGTLLPSWEHDIKTGFDECMRVLEPYGILIFKWNEVQISAQKILSLIPYQPLVGHPTAKHGKTIWMCFMKIPNTEQ
jgi:23S rRNA G2069 N7-methylase RlmK/C1962 C5-methylase RlmI